MTPFARKEIGDWGESYAVRYLRRHGYRILARNWRYGHWELDIVAVKDGDIVFAEVKTRSYEKDRLDSDPPPGMAIRQEKIRSTRSAAIAFLRENPTDRQPRMDVVEVFLEKAAGRKRPKLLRINHFEAAY